MTQSIVIQVGQCGNQIGNRFWNLALREHSFANEKAIYDSALSTFFINGATDNGGYLPVVSGLKARAVLVDMEEGVVGELFKSPLRNIYDNRFLITDVSGSGNNWAVGKYFYGTRYHDELKEVVRKSVELCDCLQCFFLIHSLGGGTGSGVGTHLLKILADEYPNVYRIVTAVFPSMDDDVITSPYNTVLGLNQLTELADCVLPVDNLALTGMIGRLKGSSTKPVPKGPSLIGNNTTKQQSSSNWPITATPIDSAGSGKAFDEMNNIVANMLLNLTSSSRFEGTMNVDINEISMNLVPFPRLHYLIAAQSPLTNISQTVAPRKVDQLFADAFTRDFQLISADPCRHTYLAAALLVRGSVTASDIRRNIDRLQQRLRFVQWNREGWKVGHCLVPPVGLPSSLLTLSNNTAIRERFLEILERFYKLYKRKAHLHHYTNVDGFDLGLFKASADSLEDLYQEYDQLEKQTELGTNPQLLRLQISS
ncbi:Tubulin epsilon chain [Clonorchis sinensis]|uniref:Tubulin epsilon chain n=2 Tax=Clonorchis sinensis TaxID=79923 RepID=A0A8T1M2K7_CLOSI|nr:Tubulin epsilon chain [Clonorchis sinensis]